MKILLTTLALAFGMNAMASSLADFEKRFSFIRDKKGKLLEVRDNSITMDVNFKSFLKNLKDGLLLDQRNLRSQSIDEQVEMIMAQAALGSENGTARDIEWLAPHIKKSLGEAYDQNIDALFANEDVKRVVDRFEAELQKNWKLMGLNLIARPSDSTYFYKRNVTYQIVKMVLNLAKDQLSEVPILNFAAFVVVEYEKLVSQRRRFHQNMLLHYLELIPEGKLGLTKAEADHIFSSIYESRIDYLAFNESKKAKKSWDSYGTDIFFKDLRLANKLLITRPDLYDTLGKRLNYAFQDAMVEGRPVILNLFDKAHMFSGNHAIAYEYEAPEKVRNLRVLFRLARFGLGFVSIPSFIKNTADDFLSSLYFNQALTEGALAAHFASEENFVMKKAVIRQTLNPFINF